MMKQATALSSLLILSLVPASATVVVSVSPAFQTAAIGSTVTTQIAISGLGLDTAPSLGAYDLNLAFNPAVLSFSGVTFGDPGGDQLNLSGAGTISDFGLLSSGLLEFYEISLDPLTVLDTQQSSHFVLATATFTAIGAGTSSLSPVVNSIGDSSGTVLSAALQSGSVNVVATPEPNTFALLIPLVWLLWRGSRLRSNPACSVQSLNASKRSAHPFAAGRRIPDSRRHTL